MGTDKGADVRVADGGAVDSAGAAASGDSGRSGRSSARLSSGPHNNVTAKDVAAHAGVSIATVSLVANGKADGRVSGGTQTRVAAAIKELGYVVNPAARSLVTGKHGRIALLANDITNPFIASIATGIGEILGSDTQLILSAPGHEAASPNPMATASMGVDGMLINLADIDPELANRGRDVPLVILDEPLSPAHFSRAYFDLSSGTRELADHLVSFGHRSMAYLDSNRSRSSFDIRRTELIAAFKESASGRTKVVRARAGIEIGAAREVVRTHLEQWINQGVSVIVAATDIQAYGVLRELANQGIAVPEQMSVAGYDNNAFSEVVSPPLTSVDLPAADLGRQAATLLVEQIARGTKPGRTVILPTSLMIRSSTGPAAR
ncbi:LacI family DNA-binding transcriptional regulator [Williamsia sp.]|uniref:LacI family DNA-binding transcriptional regulator n=1 Tax=Williamsia sp. TaxID=1872085 RepID=UPI002F934532